MIRRLLLIFTIVCIAIASVKAQRIGFQDLLSFAGKKDWTEVNSILAARGWEFDESSSETVNRYGQIGWSYEKSDWDNTAEEWLRIYTHEETVVSVWFQTGVVSRYKAILTAARSNGFKKSGSSIENGEIITLLKKRKWILKIKSKIQKEEYSDRTSTIYTFTISKE